MTKEKNKSLILFRKNATEAEAEAARREAEKAGFKVVSVHKFKFQTPDQIALAWGQSGDWGTLAEYILSGGEITSEMREFLAAVLQGKAKRPKKTRPPTLKRVAGLLNRVGFFLSLLDQGARREQAIDQTAEKYGVDRRTIQRDLKEGENAVRLLIALGEH
jgi:hypothetical protein